jgi:hypothetical protein
VPYVGALSFAILVQMDSYNTNTAVEFVDVRGLESRFGIRRSLAYELIKRNAIRSVSLRKRGALRGKRLFDVQSVREFLHRQGAES